MRRTAPAELYDSDYALWIEQQVSALRIAPHTLLSGIDVENLIDELEGLARSERASLLSHLTTLAVHLLKLYEQPSMATWHWIDSIDNAATHIRDLLDASHSMKSLLAEYYPKAYARARRKAHIQTGIPITDLPETPTEKFALTFAAIINGEEFLELERIVQRAAAGRKTSYSVRRGKRR